MELPILLQYLAHSLGQEELVIPEGEALTLVFDDIRVHIEPDPETGHCYLYSVLSRLPGSDSEQLTIFREVLSANNFGRGTGFAAFSVDAAQNELLLEQSFAPQQTEPEALHALLSDFVTVVEAWRKRLPELGAQSPAETEIGEHFIRA
jgi:Tir chaperone protein (CesT) family